MMLFIGLIILSGLFNPWTGLFGKTFYSPKYREPEKLEKEIIHRSFHLTK